MNYATWKLNFTDPEYGTGPEEAIAELGIKAEAGWVDGSPENSGTIMGYLSFPVDEIDLEAWQVENISQEEALDFCRAVNSEAFIDDSGTIVVPSVLPEI